MGAAGAVAGGDMGADGCGVGCAGGVMYPDGGASTGAGDGVIAGAGMLGIDAAGMLGVIGVAGGGGAGCAGGGGTAQTVGESFTAPGGQNALPGFSLLPGVVACAVHPAYWSFHPAPAGIG